MMKFIFVLFALVQVGHATVTGTLVGTQNPTICDPNVKQYSGYFNIDSATKKEYFYWSFSSRSNPATDPVVLWMTGGPGCSSLLALLEENGPCKPNKDGSDTVNNTYSWTNNANMIYIDQPAGVGFSTATQAGYDSNEEQVANDMYAFLQAFFQAHPEWQLNPFFVFGESYGGHYAPATAHRVWSGNQNGTGLKINLQGVGVGNGLTDPEVQYQYYAQLAYNYSQQKIGHPVISLSTYKSMTKAIPSCISLIKDCNNGKTSSCSVAQEQCNSAEIGPYEQTGLNPYDIRIPCQVPGLCYDFSAATTYLNTPNIQAALGVVAGSQWQSCNYAVNGAFSNDWMRNFQTQLPDMLASGIRVRIYAGDVDFICNWIGNKAWTLALAWPGSAAFNAAQDLPYMLDGKQVGEVRSAQGFEFVRVYDAGHMVPMDQPAVALAVLNDFIFGKK